jgi:trans-aconitate methyltransferase
MDAAEYKNTRDVWNKVAQMYHSKFSEIDLYNDTYDLFCELISKPNAEVFEIGCGPGNITSYLLNKRSDFKLEAIDVAPNMIEFAKQMIPTANFRVMDCRAISDITTRYDGIMCGFCMPYLTPSDCEKLIHDSAALLNENGIVYFSTIEGNNEHSTYEVSSNGEHKMFINYHEEAYLLSAMQKNKLEVVKIFRKPYSKADGSNWVHWICIGRKL